MKDYAADKAKIYERTQLACVYSVADPATVDLVREADVVEGARAIGFTLGMPAVGQPGLVEDLLVDRAFMEQRDSSAVEQIGCAHDRTPVTHDSIVFSASAAQKHT